MCNLKYNKKAIIISLILIISICNGCAINKNTPVLNIESVKNNAANYLIENEYEIETNNSDKNEFSVQGKKDNKIIHINFVNLRDDYSRCSITVDDTIENYSQKYNSINYKELFELSQILGIKKVTDDIIKNACEDERNFYDSTDADYFLPSDKIMSKIYRVGFFENPVIMYELSANDKYTETITILWNS